MFDKQRIIRAMNQPGFANWISPLINEDRNRPLRRPSHLNGAGSVAAVMLLIYENDPRRQSTIVLTKRRTDLNHHPGQISLPGGRQDAGESLVTTSLRETQEEIGVEPSKIEILGELNPVYIPPSDFTIHPFVGWHSGRPVFQISEVEVETIIEAPLSELLRPETLGFGNIESETKYIESAYFSFESHQIWGATAIVIHELLERIRAAE